VRRQNGADEEEEQVAEVVTGRSLVQKAPDSESEPDDQSRGQRIQPALGHDLATVVDEEVLHHLITGFGTGRLTRKSGSHSGGDHVRDSGGTASAIPMRVIHRYPR
jgi:hypothetical protein